MEELELLYRLTAIRDLAKVNYQIDIERALNRLILDRWGPNSVETVK